MFEFPVTFTDAEREAVRGSLASHTSRHGHEWTFAKYSDGRFAAMRNGPGAPRIMLRADTLICLVAAMAAYYLRLEIESVRGAPPRATLIITVTNTVGVPRAQMAALSGVARDLVRAAAVAGLVLGERLDALEEYTRPFPPHYEWEAGSFLAFAWPEVGEIPPRAGELVLVVVGDGDPLATKSRFDRLFAPSDPAANAFAVTFSLEGTIE
jgi:hypothetical protein